MWVGKNNLCAGGMLSATIEYNGFAVCFGRIGTVVYRNVCLKIQCCYAIAKQKLKKFLPLLQLL